MNEKARLLIKLQDKVFYMLGDHQYNSSDVCVGCEQDGRKLVTTWRGGYPPADDSIEVQGILPPEQV